MLAMEKDIPLLYCSNWAFRTPSPWFPPYKVKDVSTVITSGGMPPATDGNATSSSHPSSHVVWIIQPFDDAEFSFDEIS
jgi:hypothetical protein